MRSFVFCTSFMAGHSIDRSAARWERWIDYYQERKGALGAERLFLVDDGTPLGAIPPALSIVSADEPLPERLPEGPTMFRFARRLGRSSITLFPGWWRSFTFASQVARRYSFSKIIHCESDAYVISHRLAEYIRTLGHGWTAFWCPRHAFPEAALQVICGGAIADLEHLHGTARESWYRAGPADFAELCLPFTNVNRGFRGDRYGEYGDEYPDNADYVCQTRMSMTVHHRLRQAETAAQ